jgi:hypothetical protein
VDAKDRDKESIRVMVWAAIAKGFKSKLHIYKPEDILSPEEQNKVIQQANQLLKDRTQHRQEAALHPGTEKFQILQDVNTNIVQQNIDQGRTGRHK